MEHEAMPLRKEDMVIRGGPYLEPDQHKRAKDWPVVRRETATADDIPQPQTVQAYQDDDGRVVPLPTASHKMAACLVALVRITDLRRRLKDEKRSIGTGDGFKLQEWEWTLNSLSEHMTGEERAFLKLTLAHLDEMERRREWDGKHRKQRDGVW